MCRLNPSTVDIIVKDCLEVFKKLPKTGKPVELEWTVLSCIVKYESLTETHSVIALGTGSKCIGSSKMSPIGNILNDSHAEIIARRGFLLYLYKNIEQCLNSKESIFILKDSHCSLKPGIDFVFYSSQLPCGDASIIPKDELNAEQVGDTLSSIKRLADEDIDGDEVVKKPRIEDIHRTGAKCLENSQQDPKLPGTAYHILGKVRTKPGRGDKTLSVSCSDKIARWIHLGIQGGLLDMLLSDPIKIKHFIFGAGVPYSENSLNRALFARNGEMKKLTDIPFIYQCGVHFPYIKSETNIKPASSSIIWVNVNNGMYESAVQGKKLGVTKKNENIPKNYLNICKFSLYKKFKEILSKNDVWKEKICAGETLEEIPYNTMKAKSKRYIEKWKDIREVFFKEWTKKPDIFAFK